MRVSAGRRTLVTAAIAVAALVLAGCGSSGSPSSSGSSGSASSGNASSPSSGSSSSGSAVASGSASSSSASASASSGGASSASGSAATPSGSTVKIGAVVTLSGPFAQIGQSHLAGAKLAVDEINKSGGAAGHPFELESKDEKADPQATVNGVRELLGSGVKLMLGGTTDSDCLGAAPLASNAGAIFIGTSCQTVLLETTKFVPGFFEIAPNNYMLAMATATYAHEHFSDLTSWDGISPDYEFGKEVWGDFQTDLKKLQPSVNFRKGVFVPLAETQFSSYISSVLTGLPANSEKTNGLFLSTFSATTAGLAKQGKSQNLFGHYGAVLNLGGSTPTAQALGADTPSIYFIYDYYDGAYKNATNTKFVSSYKAANKGEAPNAWAYEGYTAVMAYAAAIEKSNSVDPMTLRKTMAGMTFDTPKGPLTFRAEDHLLQSPVTVWHAVGDKSAPGGFKITSSEAIPAEKVLPPVNVGK